MELSQNCNDPEAASHTCSDWGEVVRYLEEFPSQEVCYDQGDVTRTGWVFRGLTDSRFCLEPAVERQARDKSMSWFALQQFIALEFQSREHIHLSPVLAHPESELTRLAQMQHYGIPTRLLDFTYSPFVALYFAIREQCSDKERSHVRLWAIDETAVNDRFKEVMHEAKMKARKRAGKVEPGLRPASPADFATDGDIVTSEIQKLPPLIAKALRATGPRRDELERQGSVAVASPPAFNPRLASQQGVFLVNCAESLSFGKSLKIMMASHSAVWCKRFDISVDAIPCIEQKLFQMNIHEQSLFPDMEGLAGLIRQRARLHWK